MNPLRQRDTRISGSAGGSAAPSGDANPRGFAALFLASSKGLLDPPK